MLWGIYFDGTYFYLTSKGPTKPQTIQLGDSLRCAIIVKWLDFVQLSSS